MMVMMDRAHRPFLLAYVLLVTTLASFASSRTTEADRITELLELKAGTHAADVGAGDGEWSVVLSRAVGESGHVYVTEIDEAELDKIRERLRASDPGNVSVVVGKADDTMLPDSCCDAILLRLVVHHMDDREAMIASLRRSIGRHGLLLVIEKYPRHDHGIAPEELIEAMSQGGFRVISRHLEWDDEGDLFAILFRAGGEPLQIRR